MGFDDDLAKRDRNDYLEGVFGAAREGRARRQLQAGVQ
jgi:hypothetical protein